MGAVAKRFEPFDRCLPEIHYNNMDASPTIYYCAKHQFWTGLFTGPLGLGGRSYGQFSSPLVIYISNSWLWVCLQVVAHHEDLLSQATGIETLDGSSVTAVMCCVLTIVLTVCRSLTRSLS